MAARPERSDPTQHVELDLNSPAFLRSWCALEEDEKIRVLNASEKISQLTCTQLYRDAGLKWEEIARSPIPLPPKVGVVYSLRITQGRRALRVATGISYDCCGSRRITIPHTPSRTSD